MNTCVFSFSALTLDQWEDAYSPGYVLRWGKEPAQQMAEASGIYGRTCIQQRMAGEDWKGDYRMPKVCPCVSEEICSSAGLVLVLCVQMSQKEVLLL